MYTRQATDYYNPVEIGAPPKGSLAQPGEKELLERYRVTIEEIANRLLPIIKEANLQAKGSPDKYNESYLVREGRYKVVMIKTEVDMQWCEYCGEIGLYNTIYKITNVVNATEMRVMGILHGLKHGDLSRYSPEKICNLLEIGDTWIPESDPLFKVAKYYHRVLEKEVENL